MAVKILSKITKAAYFSPLSPFEYRRDIPDPKLPASDWIRVSNIQTGICGSDVTLLKCTAGADNFFEPMPPASGKVFLGHETVGMVTEIGAEVTDLKVGDRVTIVQYTQCCGNKGIEPMCPNCLEGNYSICDNYAEPSPYGVEWTGAGFGDSYITPRKAVMKIDERLTDDQAVLLEPYAVALHAVLRHLPQPNEKVLVYGTGTIGLCVISALKALAPQCVIHVPVRSQRKAEMVRKFGADVVIDTDVYEACTRYTGAKVYKGMGSNRATMGGFDCVYDTLGNAKATHNALRWLRARGTYVKIGYQMNPTHYDETPLWLREITVIGTSSHGMEHWQGRDITSFELASELMTSGKLVTDGMITHRFTMDEYKKGFKAMINRPKKGGSDVIKIVLYNEKAKPKEAEAKE